VVRSGGAASRSGRTGTLPRSAEAHVRAGELRCGATEAPRGKKRPGKLTGPVRDLGAPAGYTGKAGYIISAGSA
jgi:hypothetical protein